MQVVLSGAGSISRKLETCEEVLYSLNTAVDELTPYGEGGRKRGRGEGDEWEGGWGNDNGREDEERKWKEIGEGIEERKEEKEG